MRRALLLRGSHLRSGHGLPDGPASGKLPPGGLLRGVPHKFSSSQQQHLFQGAAIALDRVLAYAIEPIKSDAPPGEGCWLVMDIIKAAPSARVIARHLIDELNRRQGVLPPSEEMRIRQLVESTVNSIIHMKREPNGFTFTGRGVPMAHDQNNRPVRDCRWSSSLSRTANSWTTWPADVYGSDVDMNSKTVLTRIATLIVAAVLCDQLK